MAKKKAASAPSANQSTVAARRAAEAKREADARAERERLIAEARS
jgi:hypothetical protein